MKSATKNAVSGSKNERIFTRNVASDTMLPHKQYNMVFQLCKANESKKISFRGNLPHYDYWLVLSNIAESLRTLKNFFSILFCLSIIMNAQSYGASANHGYRTSNPKSFTVYLYPEKNNKYNDCCFSDENSTKYVMNLFAQQSVLMMIYKSHLTDRQAAYLIYNIINYPRGEMFQIACKNDCLEDFKLHHVRAVILSGYKLSTILASQAMLAACLRKEYKLVEFLFQNVDKPVDVYMRTLDSYVLRTREYDIESLKILLRLYNQQDIMDTLLRKICQFSRANWTDTIIDDRAIEQYKIQLVKLLMLSGADIRASVNQDVGISAANNREYDLLFYLLDNGVNVNYVNEYGLTVLSLIIYLNHYDENIAEKYVKRILTYGADPNLGNPLPLAWALSSEFKNVARILYNAGASIDLPSVDGENSIKEYAKRQGIKFY